MDRVGWAKAHLRRAHLSLEGWWARGVYHRARVRATRWLSPPYLTNASGRYFDASFLIAAFIDDAVSS
jgi:hypothetical protein